MEIDTGHRSPFGVGKILEVRENGQLHYQWYGNYYYNANGTFTTGWRDTADGMGYYGRCQSRKDEPWTEEHTEHEVNESELIARAWDIFTKDKKLNAKTWKLITDQFGPKTVWPPEPQI